MAQILGLQESVRKPLPKERDPQAMLETERCIWWAIVIVERYVHEISAEMSPADGCYRVA